jgi:hypothetical protein
MNGVVKTLIVGALCVPAAAFAQGASRPTSGFNYSYVELEYADMEFDVPGGDIDGDGFTLKGSFELQGPWLAFASYGQADLDFGLDLDTWTIGAGYVHSLQDDLDLIGRVMYIKQDFDLPGADDDGLGISGGIRYRVNQDFELEGALQYVHVDDSDTSLRAEGRYFFTPEFSAGVALMFGGDAEGIAINARYSF